MMNKCSGILFGLFLITGLCFAQPAQEDSIVLVHYIAVADGVMHSCSGVILDPKVIVVNSASMFGARHIAILLPDGSVIPAINRYVVPDAGIAFLEVEKPIPVDPIQLHLDTIDEGSQVYFWNNENFKEMDWSVNSSTNDLSNDPSFIEINFPFDEDPIGPLLDQDGKLVGMLCGKKYAQQKTVLLESSKKIWDQYQLFLSKHE